MTSNFIRYDQDQQHILPKDLSEWVEEDSLEQFVSDTIDYLDEQDRLELFYPEESDENRGRPQYHPVMLLKVLVFGYAQGIRSSRKLNRLLERDVAFRYLAANQQPDFRTISTFCKNHREDFQHLFVEILQLCRQAGMAQMGEVALDGRRVQGDAALKQNRTREQIEEEIQEILDEAADIGEEEDEEYGPENRGDELPEELQDKESRLKRLREAKAQLDEKEQEQKEKQAEMIREREEKEVESGEKMRGRKPKRPEDVEPDEDTKANTTDPESQTMKGHDGWKQGYNGQAMVDCDSQVIVAQDITTDANDKQQLQPMLDEWEDVNGQLPSNVLADAGYWSKENAELEDEQTELFYRHDEGLETAQGTARERATTGTDSGFSRTERADGTKIADETWERHLWKTGPERRTGVRSARERGLDRFMLRGEEGAAAEWSLFSATHNLLKLWRTRWESAG